MWVPLAAGGPANGYRYRDTLRPLATEELLESHDEAMGRVGDLSGNSSASLGEWEGRGPALSVYAQWTVYALYDREVVDIDESKRRLKRPGSSSGTGCTRPIPEFTMDVRMAGWRRLGGAVASMDGIRSSWSEKRPNGIRRNCLHTGARKRDRCHHQIFWWEVDFPR
jgi:hypothetical protein